MSSWTNQIQKMWIYFHFWHILPNFVYSLMQNLAVFWLLSLAVANILYNFPYYATLKLNSENRKTSKIKVCYDWLIKVNWCKKRTKNVPQLKNIHRKRKCRRKKSPNTLKHLKSCIRKQTHQRERVRQYVCECVWVCVSVCECVWVCVRVCECLWERKSEIECVCVFERERERLRLSLKHQLFNNVIHWIWAQDKFSNFKFMEKKLSNKKILLATYPTKIYMSDAQHSKYGKYNLYVYLNLLTQRCPGVNFINILRAAFTLTGPNSTKKCVKSSSFFALLGSASVKAARSMLVKLTLGD